jgi:histidinol phosphatase-like PHP family hydrolase
MINNPDNQMDLIGHPFGVYNRVYPIFQENYIRTLLQACKTHNVAFEISTKYRLDWSKLFPLLKEINPPISFGSDAHETVTIGRDYSELREWIGKYPSTTHSTTSNQSTTPRPPTTHYIQEEE